MCDVDADTVVMQQTLKLPIMQYSASLSVDAPAVMCDVDAPTMVLQETPMLHLHVPDQIADSGNPRHDSPNNLSSVMSPNTDAFGPGQRRSSFLVPLDHQVRVGGVSKRRSSCAFAVAPLAVLSPEKTIDEDSFRENEPDVSAGVIVAESPLLIAHASSSPSRLSYSASRRKTTSAQSPAQTVDIHMPRRFSFNVKSPSGFGKSETPLKIEINNPSILVHTEPTPPTIPFANETADQAPPAITNDGENVDPNQFKKTPEKKKRRLYNPARIPDALLEE
jgi:hypothetical protein